MTRPPTTGPVLANGRTIATTAAMTAVLTLAGVVAVTHVSGAAGPGEQIGLASQHSSVSAHTAATTAPPADQAILGNTCNSSKLPPHDGFQAGNRCVSTEFGEVGDFDKNPTLIISQAPRRVRVGQAFTLKVSTRNLVRDRFLAAGKGGYYKESSFLNAQGLVRGHFHTACRMLTSTKNAPPSGPPSVFFVATEDGGGGSAPDTVTISIAGLPTAGLAQCAAWAGDGSHRIPMMASVQALPAMDSVRIRVQP